MPFENNFLNLFFLISAIGSMLIVFWQPVKNRDKHVDEKLNLMYRLPEDNKKAKPPSETATRKSLSEQTIEINMILDTIQQSYSQPVKSIHDDPHHNHSQSIDFGSTSNHTSDHSSYSSHDSSGYSSPSSDSVSTSSSSSDSGSGGSSCD